MGAIQASHVEMPALAAGSNSVFAINNRAVTLASAAESTGPHSPKPAPQLLNGACFIRNPSGHNTFG